MSSSGDRSPLPAVAAKMSAAAATDTVGRCAPVSAFNKATFRRANSSSNRSSAA